MLGRKRLMEEFESSHEDEGEPIEPFSLTKDEEAPDGTGLTAV